MAEIDVKFMKGDRKLARSIGHKIRTTSGKRTVRTKKAGKK